MRRTAPELLVAAALIALSGIALVLRACGGEGPSEPPASERTSTRSDAGPLAIATHYALAATNWRGAGYLAAWRAQRRLASARYRRQLALARPSAAELRWREREGQAERGEIVAAETVATSKTRARVLVSLRQRTIALDRSAEIVSLNEVRLVRERRRWCVARWSVLPLTDAEASR